MNAPLSTRTVADSLALAICLCVLMMMPEIDASSEQKTAAGAGKAVAAQQQAQQQARQRPLSGCGRGAGNRKLDRHAQTIDLLLRIGTAERDLRSDPRCNRSGDRQTQAGTLRIVSRT